MLLQLDFEQVRDLLRAFHTLTGLRIVIFDDACREVIAWPADHGPLCACLKSHQATKELCRQSDAAAFERCRKTGKLTITHCHAGLVEATAPIYDRGLIIGYFMFGQLTDRQDRQALVREFCRKFARLNVDLPDPNTDEAANSIQYRSLAEIRAAAKILEALTSYVLLHHLVTVRHERLVNQIDQYISEHVSGQIAAADLCQALGIGRTRLYELTRQYLGMGLAAYVTLKRMDMARQLLSGTNLTIGQVAARTGYDDYTYFSKVFRKTNGVSPSAYRQKAGSGSSPD
ncbi:MAG: PocR ligand-binding domain-containing protein [Eubacteriales bacterium]|jgi:AraC-like DNA-binding protein|nr:PocR ligand-binding domain-containing protein [Eubacteriales bacterium]MDD4139422.1 PocR ligand-binding domain-containing protein [Eubacteriales bacterium]